MFGFSLLLVTMLVVLMQWSLGKGMIEYVNTKEVEALKPVAVELANEYRKEGNWHSMFGQHIKFRHLISEQLRGSEFAPQREILPPEYRHFRGPPRKHLPAKRLSSERLSSEHLSSERPARKNRQSMDDFPPEGLPPPILENQAHYALLDSGGNIIVGKYFDDQEYSKTAIELEHEIVGYFAVSKRNSLTQGYEVDFIEQQQNYLWLIALVALCLVALVTLPLARHVVAPIKVITRGMHKLTQGDYQQSIEMKRQDELGELSRDYNELALTLAENESARKRWLANISHELRTPVAILRGELEAMLDDVRPLTKKNIASANDEVKHLHRLIDDLNLLTSADIGAMTYRKQDEDLVELVTGELAKYHSYLADAGIKLSQEFIAQKTPVYVDKNRLYQLFENIINNAIKYSSATRLKISLSVDKTASKPIALMKFEDDGIGVDECHLANLFEHLYRVDDSRNRKTGGAGLGLSICRHIVIAHQGEISAERASIGGLAIIIKLPIS